MRKKSKKITAILYVVNIFISLVFVLPLYYTLINSLNPLYMTPAVLKPKGFELINYYYAVSLIPFVRYLKNSVIIVSIGVGLSFIMNFFYGYAFARLKASGKGLLFNMTLAQMMIPGFAIQVPQYIFFSMLNIKDTYWIWVLNGIAGNAFIIFMYRQYLSGISREIEEAAIIDGCGYFSIITKIFMPISKPIIAVAIFYEFTAHWGDYMTPFMYLTENKYPLAIALFGMNYVLPQNPSLKMTPVINAAAILLMIPVVIVFFFCQKNLVSGITAGSVKG